MNIPKMVMALHRATQEFILRTIENPNNRVRVGESSYCSKDVTTVTSLRKKFGFRPRNRAVPGRARGWTRASQSRMSSSRGKLSGVFPPARKWSMTRACTGLPLTPRVLAMAWMFLTVLNVSVVVHSGLRFNPMRSVACTWEKGRKDKYRRNVACSPINFP